MKIVTEVILEYLGSNRRLVIPALGAFMVKDTGEFVFSDLLRNDDGVLTSLLRNGGMSDMEAAVVVERFVFEVRHELEQYGYCRLGEVGTLRLEPDTKVLRLYPPVKSEVVLPEVQAPYVPEPIVEEPKAEAEAEAEAEPCEEVADVAEESVEEQPMEEQPVEEVLPMEETSVDEAPMTQPEEIVPQPKEEEIQPKEEAVEPKVEPAYPEEEKVQPKFVTPHPKKAERRVKFDLVMIVAIAVIVAALALIALGVYNANISEKANDAVDNAAMDNVRLITEPGNNND